jgi:hypothetical protein
MTFSDLVPSIEIAGFGSDSKVALGVLLCNSFECLNFRHQSFEIQQKGEIDKLPISASSYGENGKNPNKCMSENGYLFRPNYVTWEHDWPAQLY